MFVVDDDVLLSQDIALQMEYQPVGDQVTRVLARLLQESFRRSDIVGRYGGEEFAVIFPNTSVVAAVAILEKIRDTFSKIRHYEGNTDFTSSFSAGIVELDDCRWRRNLGCGGQGARRVRLAHRPGNRSGRTMDHSPAAQHRYTTFGTGLEVG